MLGFKLNHVSKSGPGDTPHCAWGRSRRYTRFLDQIDDHPVDSYIHDVVIIEIIWTSTEYLLYTADDKLYT